MRYQNNNDIKFPLEWQRFRSNMVINPSRKYVSPFFEKNNFLMIGGMTKKSFYFKTLATVLGYDYESLDQRKNFNYDVFNPYDVISGLDTLVKFDRDMYNEYLDPYTTEVQDNNGTIVSNGIVNKEWHGTFENSDLTETDIATTKVYRGVKPMWEQLGFPSIAFDKPNQDRYWKNIIPKEFNLSNRFGIVERDLPDPQKGSITPRIDRKEFIIDEEIHQYWDDGYFWPNLSKFDKFGVFSGDYPAGRFFGSASIDENQQFVITNIPIEYGREDSDILSSNVTDANLIFDLTYDDDQILDKTDNFEITYNTDFSLEINDDDRIVRKVVDHFDPIEKDKQRQAF